MSLWEEYRSNGRKGMEMKGRCRTARDRGTQGPRSTGTALMEAGSWENAVSLGELGCRIGPFMTPEASEPLHCFLACLFLSPWTLSSSSPSASAWQAHLNKANQKREEVAKVVFVLQWKPNLRADEKSIKALFEDGSPLGAVRGVGNASGMVCLPDPWLPGTFVLDKDRSRLEMTKTAV